MFSKKKCENCGTDYDELGRFCPNCLKDNQNPIIKKYDQMIFLSPVKEAIVFLIGWLGLKGIALLISIFFGLYAGAIYSEEDALVWLGTNQVNMALQVLAYSTLFITLFAFLYNNKKLFFIQFTKIKPLIYGVAGGFLLIAASSAYGMILQALNIETTSNANETLVETLMISFPIASFFVIGVLGPVCEELTYRVGLFSFLHRINRYLAYAVTFLVFGLIHYDFSASTQAEIFNELLQLPNYLIAGFLLCFYYEKFGFATSTYAHLTNNLFSFFVTIILHYTGN